jgi:hypothetical protein
MTQYLPEEPAHTAGADQDHDRQLLPLVAEGVLGSARSVKDIPGPDVRSEHPMQAAPFDIPPFAVGLPTQAWISALGTSSGIRQFMSRGVSYGAWAT